MTATTLDESIRADSLLVAALRPLNRRRRATLGRVREFFPTVGEWSGPTLSAEVVFDPSASAPVTADGKRIVVGNEAFRFLDSTRRLGKALAAACDQLDSQLAGSDRDSRIHQHASETKVVRYAAAETMPSGGLNQGSAAGGTAGHKVGETKSVNGVTYRLNENHRWELADPANEQAAGIHSQATGEAPPVDQQATQGDAGPFGASDSPRPESQSPGQRWKGQADQPSLVDQTTHEDRHKFVVSQARKLPAGSPVRGVIAAMMQSPEYRQGGEYATSDFAAEQSSKLYAWMKQNAGQTTAGGQFVDLGKGRLGFSSPAGAVVVWPPDANGRQKVGYTNATGIVAQGMGVGSGGNAGGGVAPSAGQPGQPQPAGSEPVAPPIAGQPAAASQATASAAAAAAPPVVQQPTGPAAVPVASETPTAKADETLAPPVDPRPARQVANEARTRLDDAIATYEQATASGKLDAKGNARWKQYIAALKRVWLEKDQSAGRGEREEKKATREARQQEKNRMREGESSRRKAEVEQRRSESDRERQARKAEISKEREVRKAKLAEREAERERERKAKAGRRAEKEKHKAMGLRPGKTPPVDGKDIHAANVAEAERDAARRKSSGQPKGNQPRPLIETPPGDGSGYREPSPEAMQRAAEMAKLPKRQQRLHSLADHYLGKFNVSNSPENKKLLSDAIKAGRIRSPRELRGVLRTAKKLHERGNLSDADHPHVKDAIRRKANREGRGSWKLTRNKQAESWGMEPEQYEEIARDVWKEHAERHQEREAAKRHARKLTGLSAKDVRQLEELGFDSGSDHPQIAKFDEAAGSIAAAYPGLGWGEGSSDEGKEIDHGEKLWALLREGSKPLPSRTSPEFLEYVDSYLESRQRSAGSGESSRGGDSAGASEEESAVPFAKRREFVRQYRKSTLDYVRRFVLN